MSSMPVLKAAEAASAFVLKDNSGQECGGGHGPGLSALSIRRSVEERDRAVSAIRLRVVGL